MNHHHEDEIHFRFKVKGTESGKLIKTAIAEPNKAGVKDHDNENPSSWAKGHKGVNLFKENFFRVFPPQKGGYFGKDLEQAKDRQVDSSSGDKNVFCGFWKIDSGDI